MPFPLLKSVAIPDMYRMRKSIASGQIRQVFPSLSVQETEMSFYFKIRRATAAQSAVVKIDRAPCSSKQDRAAGSAAVAAANSVCRRAAAEKEGRERDRSAFHHTSLNPEKQTEQ